ncbi:MAG TPA: hypothetical protein VFD91_01345 [Mariniphaga sp.]|nr:hypothetical protein [Mariniphaga sp.]
MKKPGNIFYILIAVVTGVMAVGGFFQGKYNDSQEVAAVKLIGQEQCFLEQLNGVPRFGLREIDVTTVSSGPFTSLVKHLQKYKAIVRNSEVQILNSLGWYLSQIVFFPVRIRKADLLYPFHYFF